MADWDGAYPDPVPPVRIWQKPEEISELVAFYRDLKPRNVLEIGCESGGTLWYWINLAPPGAHIVACDLLLPAAPSSVHGHYVWPEWAHEKGVELVIANFLSIDVPALIDVVNRHCPDGLDFSFIDAAHDYQSSARDFETCYNLTKPSGVIALHDIGYHNPTSSEVDVLWAELKGRYRHQEIINLPRPNGIGLIFKD